MHLHDTDFYLHRFIFEYEMTQSTRSVGNIILAGTDADEAALGYALAIRHSLSPSWAVGMEAIGDWNAKGYQQLIFGISHTPTHHLSLRPFMVTLRGT